MSKRRNWSIRICTWILFLCSLPVGAIGSEIDRLLAAVNGNVITYGDLDLARKLNAVIGNDVNGSGRESRRHEIDRLIDLELMRQELKNFSISQEDEVRVQSRLRELRELYQGNLSPLLVHLGLQESELISYLRLESSILKFVDFRFRPFVSVSDKEVKEYFESKLALQLREAGIDLPPLEQVSERIKEILRQEKINDVMVQWIKDIRRNSRIDYYDADSGL